MPSWPATGLGRTALVASIIAIAGIVVLPLITAVFGDIFPVTDSVVMPLIGAALLLTASVLTIVAVAIRRHRSIVIIAALVSVLAPTVFFAPIVIGEALAELF